jgi:hypothetical protein
VRPYQQLFKGRSFSLGCIKLTEQFLRLTNIWKKRIKRGGQEVLWNDVMLLKAEMNWRSQIAGQKL